MDQKTDNLDAKYERLLKETQDNSDIIGLMWGGSRGKSERFTTQYSDYDVCLVVRDEISYELKKNLADYRSERFEVWVRTLSEFRDHAAWGSHEAWDRYNFSHNKAVIDKTGEIQRIIDEKGVLPAEAQREVIEEALDNYINQVYRSAKYWRDGNELAAYFDATESLPPLMIALYGLEGRLNPYNKYFEWELKNYPLKFLPWPADEFICDYKHILETGDIKTQEKIFKAVRRIFQDQGFRKSIDGWDGYYFVGDSE